MEEFLSKREGKKYDKEASSIRFGRDLRMGGEKNNPIYGQHQPLGPRNLNEWIGEGLEWERENVEKSGKTGAVPLRIVGGNHFAREGRGTRSLSKQQE